MLHIDNAIKRIMNFRRQGYRGKPYVGGRQGNVPRHRPTQNNSDLSSRDFSRDVIHEIGSPSEKSITIAVEGCCHGELDAIYARIQRYEKDTQRKVDLLICCGDFQSLRNMADFHCLAVPPKYRALGSFYKYYSGESTAPFLTLFVGGNHEASQPLQELYYGGWVAPRIYYLGAAGVVNFQGLRIGGISGIYKPNDYSRGIFERPPYDNSSLRSIYHVRNIHVYQMLSLSQSKPLDIMVSHDWPQGIEQYGDKEDLLRRKPFFRKEVEENNLGSPANRMLLEGLRPRYWFAAHLHVKFSATVHHKTKSKSLLKNHTLVPSSVVHGKATKGGDYEGKIKSRIQNEDAQTQFIAVESQDPCHGPDLTEQMTQFLSLDKCLPRRQYASVLHVPGEMLQEGACLEYDLEWLAVLRKTHHLIQTNRSHVELPATPAHVSLEEMHWVRERLGGSLRIPDNFCRTVPAHAGPASPLPRHLPPPIPRMGNPQTDRLLYMLELHHKVTIPFQEALPNTLDAAFPVDKNQINIEDTNLDQDDNEIDLEDIGDDEQLDEETCKRPRVEPDD